MTSSLRTARRGPGGPVALTDETAALPAAAAGSWADGGTLPLAGFWGQPDTSAVLLNNGKVLLAGGEDGRRNALNSAMLFDAGSSTWTPTGSLQTGRRLHAVAKLDDGRVLVSGGVAGALAAPATGIATAEIYNPDTGTWSPAAPMRTARFSHSATVLPGGKVLVAGGCAVRSGDSHRALRSAEIYDPATDQWTELAPMTDGRFGHPAVYLPTVKKVLVAGGVITAGRGQYAALGYCELFDPVTGTWTPTGSLAAPRKAHQATVLADGTVLVTGGDIPGVLLDWTIQPYSQWTCERFNPATGTWSRDTDLPWGLSHHRVVKLSSGKLVVIGGTDDGTFDIGYQTVAAYDPASKVWTPAADLKTGRWAPAVALLAGDKVLVAGGVTRSGSAAPVIGESLCSETAEVFTP
ncbi:Kelch repeat-containing protein [Kribbella antibiotica]|nr:kelch repeat-containing protein [Kribbella antibiotica]